MNIHDKLLDYIINDDFPEYKSLLNVNKNIIFTGKEEINILFKCLEIDKLPFFELFIENKTYLINNGI